MTREEVAIGMVLLRNRPNYSYVIVENTDGIVNYEIVEPRKGGDEK